MKVVLTFSPHVMTMDYVESLFGSDGPVSIANEFPDVDIALDIEGNWTDGYSFATCSSLISAAETKAAFVAALRRRAPRIALGIRTDRPAIHADIIAKADWLVPQFYAPERFLVAFHVVRRFGKPIWPALSLATANKATFDGLLRTIDRLRACHPKAMAGYVIWSRRDIRTTAYAAAYLKANLPTASPQSCSEGRPGALQ